MAQDGVAPRVERPGVDWVRVADGIFVAGLGVFVFLNATGRLPWTFWFDALVMWPIVLVTGGLRIAFGRTRRAWLVVTGPLIVLGFLAAMASGRLDGSPGPWLPVAEARSPGATQVLLSGALAASRVDVTARPLSPALVVDGRRGSRENRGRIERKREGAADQVVLVTGDYGWQAVLPGRLSRWELGVSDAVPVGLRLEAVMAGAQIDLSRGQVADTALKGVFLGASLKLPRPKAPVHIRIEGVFSVVELTVPAGTPVRVHGHGFPLNVVDRGTEGDPNDAANPGYEVKADGAFLHVVVETAAP
jgi:hypothetical protein